MNFKSVAVRVLIGSGLVVVSTFLPWVGFESALVSPGNAFSTTGFAWLVVVSAAADAFVGLQLLQQGDEPGPRRFLLGISGALYIMICAWGLVAPEKLISGADNVIFVPGVSPQGGLFVLAFGGVLLVTAAFQAAGTHSSGVEPVTTELSSDREPAASRETHEPPPRVGDEEILDIREHAFGVIWGRTAQGGVTVYKETGKDWRPYAKNRDRPRSATWILIADPS